VKKHLHFKIAIALIIGIALLLMGNAIVLADSELEPGDLLFGHTDGPTPIDGISIWYGYWDHVAIYVGGGCIVEATADDLGDPKPGVVMPELTLEQFAERYDKVTVKRLKDGYFWNRYWRQFGGRDSIIEEAVDYVEEKVGDPYDWRFQKYDEAAYYCSELVWHAYDQSGVELDWNRGPIVLIDDLYFSPKLERVITIK
jgi:cell wall-associated NlpC family hydrolase